MKLAAEKTRNLICLIVCLCGIQTMAFSKTVTLGSEVDRLILDKGLEYFVDHDDKLSLDQVSQATQWNTWDQGSVNLGFSNSVYWLRFQLVNGANKDLSVILEVSFPFLQNVDVYVRDASGLQRHLRSGSLFPLQHRPMAHSLLLFPFELPADSNSQIFLRVRSDSLLQIPLAVSGEQAFIDYDHKRSLFFGAIYSLLAVIGIYHCLIYFSVRDKAYLFYGLFSFSLSFGFFLLNGSAGSYIWSWNPNLSLRGYLVSIQVSIFFAMLFIRSILNLETALPRWNKLVEYVAKGALVLLIASLFISIQAASLVGLLLANITVLISTAVIFLRTRDGYPPARYLLSAVVFTAVGIVVTISSSLTLIPSNFFTMHAVYVGLSVGTLLYAFALAYRINLERQEREQAQAELIEMQRSTNEDLDRLVKERTEELEVSNRRLREISERDGLTQLFNRGHFDTVFEKEIRRARRAQRAISVLLLDLDYFKKINDHYGHQFGDECLRTVAQIMQSSVRRPPDVAARYGGEEFVILLPETDLDGAAHVAEMIRQKVAEYTFSLNQQEIKISLSIGVNSAIPNAETTSEMLLKTADQCLYRAKQNGRNRVEIATD